MAVITQEYDVDLKAAGWYPVVEMSQYDTGSRTIVLTVYDGRELVPLNGCVARIDGRRSDGVEFSASCSVGTGSRVSFTITQEMTRAAGKHVAELVIIDANGNTVGTQNFILAVEPASMLRDAAASADDRTLYDQYTSSIEAKFNSLSKDVNRTVEDISQAIGATSKPKTIIDQGCEVDGGYFHVYLTYDPVTALCLLRVTTQLGIGGISTTDSTTKTLMKIPADYLPDASLIDETDGYSLSKDMMQPLGAARSDVSTMYTLDTSGNLILRINLPSGDSQLGYDPECNASWYARGGKFMGVTTIGTGGNTVRVGTVTTGEAGTQATVVNSGTAKDVVLDFTIPKGDKGDSGSAGGTIPVATATTLGGIKVGSNLSITDDGTLSATGGASSGFDPATVTDIVIGSGATLTNANGKGDIVIGKNAKGAANVSSTVNSNSIAIGELANAHGTYSCAVGHGAEAAYKSTAIGAASATGVNDSFGVGSEAIGCGAEATAYASVALGGNSKATETYTVSVGGPKGKRRIVNVKDPVNAQDAATKAYVDSKATSGGGSYTLPAATTTTLGGIKVGSNLTITDDGTLSATGGASSGFDPATFSPVTIGNGASFIGTPGTDTVVGLYASAVGDNATAYGTQAKAAMEGATAVGHSATVSSTTSGASYGTAIGSGASAKNNYSTAIGHGSTVSGAQSDGFGAMTSVTGTSSVALGYGSTASANSVVSVGSGVSSSSYGTRRIINVKDPTDAQDAATKAYVDSKISALIHMLEA